MFSIKGFQSLFMLKIHGKDGGNRFRGYRYSSRGGQNDGFFGDLSDNGDVLYGSSVS